MVIDTYALAALAQQRLLSMSEDISKVDLGAA